MIHFDLPKEKSSIIKVIGVGGGGSNAVNFMHNQAIEGVNFIICNTDAQAISTSTVPNKVQLGPHLTQGLGAGANPDIGRKATEESLEEIKRILEVNTKMVFITAGMGGGTGTGGAPIIAQVCRDMGILTVGIVTTPFSYEGRKRMQQAEDGINYLRDYVDTLLVISNDKLRHQFGNLKMKEAFAKADNVLATAAKCITDVINSTGQINVDFADVCTVMKNGGVAILGNSVAAGENRAQRAIEEALNSPLLNDNDIKGAQWILININSSEGEHEFTMDEVEIIQNYLLSQAGEGTDVILGLGYDNSLKEQIGITLIATGFHQRNPFEKKAQIKQLPKKEEKIVMTLGIDGEESKMHEKEQHAEEGIKDAMTPKMTVVHSSKKETEEFPEYAPLAGPDPEPVNYSPGLMEWMMETESSAETKASQDQNEQSKKEKDILDIELTEKPVGTSVSGGYLAKPTVIYEESNEDEKSNPAQPPIEEPLFRLDVIRDEDPEFDFQLVIKNDPIAAEKSRADQTPKLSSSNEPPIKDEAEEQRRKAAERLHKLRNLSFNINSADPNNEFETVPAYLRRNMELYNTITTVEDFYSNYTVKTDENNETQISTINTFLDGKKPD